VEPECLVHPLTQYRARHIKCDEQRPACQKCISSQRCCEGYSLSAKAPNHYPPRKLRPAGESPGSLVVALPTNLTASPTLFSHIGAQDWHSIHFFWAQTDFQLPGLALSTPWETLAMQLTQSEPSIAAAVAALGSLLSAWHHLPLPRTLCPTLDVTSVNLATRQYVRAISRARNLIETVATTGKDSGTEAVLVLCLVLMCFELVRGQTLQAAVHLNNGLRILHTQVGSPADAAESKRTVQLKRTTRRPLDVLTQLFVCLDCDLSMFGAAGQPYLRATHDSFSSTTPDTVPQRFDSLGEASWYLTLLSNAVSHVRGQLLALAEAHCRIECDDATMDEGHLYALVQIRVRTIDLSTYPELLAEIRRLERATKAWYAALTIMPVPSTKTEAQALVTLQIQYFMVNAPPC